MTAALAHFARKPAAAPGRARVLDPRRPTLRIARPSARLKRLGSAYTERLWVDPEEERPLTPEERAELHRTAAERTREYVARGAYHVHALGNPLGTFRGDRTLNAVLTLVGYWLNNRPELPPFDDPAHDVAAWCEPGAIGDADVVVSRRGRLVAMLRRIDGRHYPIRTEDLRRPERRPEFLPPWLATKAPACEPSI